jgi:UDP-sugar transporter A1/2/3
LSISLYQVTKQLQVLTTAFMSMVVLSAKLTRGKWIALVLLTTGIILISAQGDQTRSNVEGNFFTGVCSILIASWLSASAGVFTEYMLKSGTCSIWERNAQLSLFGVLFAICGIFSNANERANLSSLGFFHGYNFVVVVVVVLQGLGGLITAAVLKYADNILKVVVKGVALVISTIASRFLFAEGPELTNLSFQVGMMNVLFATALYSLGADALWGLLRCSRQQLPAKTNNVDPNALPTLMVTGNFLSIDGKQDVEKGVNFDRGRITMDK